MHPNEVADLQQIRVITINGDNIMLV